MNESCKRLLRKILVFVNLVGLLILPFCMSFDSSSVTDCCTEPIDVYSFDFWFPFIYIFVVIFSVIFLVMPSVKKFS